MPTRSRNDPARKLVLTPLELREEVGDKGRGVFTAVPFSRGDRVLEFLGQVRNVSEYHDLTHALQVGPREFLSSSGGIDDFVNHSCDPNTGICAVGGQIQLFALRDIAPDEEITFDYSTTQQGGIWSMECQCGSPRCRGRIGDFRDLPLSLQDFYVRSRAVLPFLIRRP